MILLKNPSPGVAEEIIFGFFLFIALAAILFNRAISVQGHLKTLPYNYFKIHPLVREEKSFKSFLFLALVAILLNGAERFQQFW